MAEHICENVYRLDIPLTGNPLKNLNSYLIMGGAGERSFLIDTGFCWDVCREAMERELDQLAVDREQMDIFCTHLHSDHAGLAAELIRPGCRTFISSVDGPRVIIRSDPAWKDWYSKYLYEGFSREEMAEVSGHAPSQSGAPVKACAFTYLEDGDELRYAGHTLRCIWTPGHTPGHMCLYEPDRKWLFCGDHILFTITPNICRWSVRPDSLGDYLESLKKIRDLPVELLLPAHREKTGTLSQRVDELLAHHERRIANTLEVIAEHPGWNAYQIAGEMKWKISARNWSEFPLTQKLFAVGETDAHLDYLTIRKRIRFEERGRVRYYYLEGSEENE